MTLFPRLAAMTHRIDELLKIMRRLRDPEKGCPWDRGQDFSTIAPYTIEEAYEVADAIERGDLADLKDELGDLLFQVVFHARMAEEAGAFGFEDVVDAIVEKMLRRHPHVFGGAGCQDQQALREAWEAEKQRERAGRNQHSALDGVARTLPALARGQKLQKRAARVGFDWPDADTCLPKVEEELSELRQAMAQRDEKALAHEAGDLLLAVSNLVRLLGLDPEQVLRQANDRFENRFRIMETQLREKGVNDFRSLDLETWENAWQQAKAVAAERGDE